MPSTRQLTAASGGPHRHRDVDELLRSNRGVATRQSRAGARRDTLRRRALAVGDVSALALAYLAAAAVSPGAYGPDSLVLLVVLPLWVLLNKLLGLYDRDPSVLHKSTLDELPSIAQSLALGTAVVYFAGVPPTGLTRATTVAFFVVATALTVALRALVRHRSIRSAPPERCLVVGSGPVAALLIRKLHAHPEHGARIVGIADAGASLAASRNGDGATREPAVAAVPHLELEDASAFERISRELAVERVIVAFAGFDHERSIEMIQTSKLLNLKVTVVPRLFEVIGAGVEVDQLEGMTLLGLRGFARTRSSLALKRAMDVAAATLGLVLLAPVLAAIAASVKLESAGPVLYRQRRVGRGSRPFRLLKFRTMVDRADELKPQLGHLNEAASPMFKIAADPRLTRVGGFLRRTSLDELPQLWNVLRGEMSLVGPRPLIPEEDDHVIGWHRSRLELTPGLTGPWQVLGRTAIPFQEMVKLDYLYVAEWSLWNDFKLLIRTAPVVFAARGH